jgi:hypothetical protein
MSLPCISGKPLPRRASDGYVCPICLESCCEGHRERCENGHSMHLLCAIKMSLYMQLKCPLCRSNLICSVCKSQKRNVWCDCHRLSPEPEDVWATMNAVYKAHFWVTVAIVFLPYHNAVSALVLLLMNCVVMMRRIVAIQRRSTQIQNWTPATRLGLRLTQFGMDLTSVLFVAVVIVLVYSIIISGLRAHLISRNAYTCAPLHA